MDNRNKDSDKNVEQAIDDIFGSDFIEIDINNNETSDNNDHKTENNFFVDKDKALFSGDFDSATKVNIFDQGTFNQTVNDVGAKSLDEEVKTEDNAFENKLDLNEGGSSIPKKDVKKDNKDGDNGKRTKIVIFVALGILVVLILLFLLLNFVIKRDEVVNCSYKAEDTGYKVTDEYKITHKGNEIKYVDGVYTYKAKNSEYEKQVEYVKNERIPAIINSNGMPGFTYLYESANDYFSVSSYLDFTMFEYDVIDKNKADVRPLSYITINSKTTYESLVKELESQGYKCTSSK